MELYDLYSSKSVCCLQMTDSADDGVDEDEESEESEESEEEEDVNLDNDDHSDIMAIINGMSNPCHQHCYVWYNINVNIRM